jgi:uncharacterized protein YkwD
LLREPWLPSTLAGLLIVTSAGALAPRAVHGATPLQMVRNVRLQGCPGHAGTREPLQLIEKLSTAASNASLGMDLKSAVTRSGYREQESMLLHVSGDTPALQRALSGTLCSTATDGHFTDVGIAQRGRDTWMVFAVPFAPPSAGDVDAVDGELLQRINAARSQPRRCGARWFAAAPPLQADRQLRVAAEAHARDMLQHNYFAHEGQDGSTPAQRVRSAGYTYRLEGENLASGPTTAQDAVDGWISSPAHCENLMDPRFTQSGVAYAASHNGPPRIVWVQEFATPR